MFSGQIEFETSAPQNACQRFEYQAHDLQLKAPKVEDATELFALVEANRARLRQWLPWLDNNQTVEHSRQFIQQMHERASLNRGFAALIFHTGKLAGIIDLHGLNWHNRTASIGYWLNKTDEGKGTMTRSAAAIIHYAFKELELNRIEVLCAVSNSRSQAIPKRLGFTHEGTLRQAECLYGQFVDHDLYALLKADWASPKTDWASPKTDAAQP
ncbi:MAG: GNAT family N-acetyltransferase [Phormidesmis sp.]